MTTAVVKGQKIDITKSRPNLTSIKAGLGWNTAFSNMEVDASAFLLGADGKIIREGDFVFYGQPSSTCGSVSAIPPAFQDKQQFHILHYKVPQEIHKIVFTITIHGAKQKGHTFKDVADIYLRIFAGESNEEIIAFPIVSSFSQETAIVAGELYRHSGEWKFNCIGAGYFGGLASLCEDFGIEVADDGESDHTLDSNNIIQATAKPAASNQSAAANNSQQQSKVNISKIELKKKQSVNIKKSNMVTATLEWETSKDLDLYCFYVTKYGETGKVYYRSLGSSQYTPYIVLDGDSQEFGKETIRIYRPEELDYVLFAAYSAFGNGTGSFKSMKAKAVVDNHMGNVVIAPLLERNDYAYWVAIAHIDFTSANEMKVSHVERYSRDHSEASPLLYRDGSFMMDVGPIEFKDDDDYDKYFD